MDTSAAPPPYNAVYGLQSASSNLTYVDFHPVMTDPGGLLSHPKYERFDALMNRANEWLRSQPQFRAITCESFETKLSNWGGVGINSDRPIYFESGKQSILYVRILRLWVITRGPGEATHPQTIGYINVIPKCLDPGGFLSRPKFCSFGETLTQVNQMFSQQPLAGRILNVETQDIKFGSWSGNCDPDKSAWLESGKHITCFLNVIRIFYETGPPANEMLGCADFVPECINAGGAFSLGQFESFGHVIQKASVWIQQQANVRVVSVQSIDYKVHNTWGGGQLNTQESYYQESGKYTTRYMRILRVCYATAMDGSYFQPPSSPFVLNYKTFTPVQLTMGSLFSPPNFEGLSQTMQRIQAWVNATGVQVVAAETVPVRMSGNQYGNAEQTYSYNHGNRGEYILFVIRLYLNGLYQEPPASSLPPVPQVAQNTDQDCCMIL